MTCGDRARGFTLIEVMVALVIAALALVAVMASISQMVDAGTAMRDRTYAVWIAQNKITEMRLANVEPEVSETSGEVEFAGLEWAWTANVSETGRRVPVSGRRRGDRLRDGTRSSGRSRGSSASRAYRVSRIRPGRSGARPWERTSEAAGRLHADRGARRDGRSLRSSLPLPTAP